MGNSILVLTSEHYKYDALGHVSKAFMSVSQVLGVQLWSDRSFFNNQSSRVLYEKDFSYNHFLIHNTESGDICSAHSVFLSSTLCLVVEMAHFPAIQTAKHHNWENLLLSRGKHTSDLWSWCGMLLCICGILHVTWFMLYNENSYIYIPTLPSVCYY